MSRDHDLIRFAQKCLMEQKGLKPPFDPVEVDFLAYCLGRYTDEILGVDIISALKEARAILNDPYLGEDDGERQQPTIDLLDSVLLKLQEQPRQVIDLETIRDLVREMRKFFVFYQIMIGECSAWNRIKKLVLPKEEL